MTVANLRIELGDTDTALPVMSDSEYQYFLDKNSGSLRRAAMDAAKSIIFKLSMRTDETVDIFSIKGSSASKSYMQALKMYISNPDMNPVYNNAMPYAGGISLSDMNTNNANSDNNIIVNPSETQSTLPNNFFEV
jgi:hypothetical protein